jgi:hypothetical protein
MTPSPLSVVFGGAQNTAQAAQTYSAIGVYSPGLGGTGAVANINQVGKGGISGLVLVEW